MQPTGGLLRSCRNAGVPSAGGRSSTLAVTMTRETEQLLATANHYLAEARRVLAKHPTLGSSTIGEITRRHTGQSLSPSEVVLAHFGSAAVRLATVCEIAGYRPTENYRRKFYATSGKRQPGWSGHKIRADIRATHTSIFICSCATMSHMKSRRSRTTRRSPLTALRYSRRSPLTPAAKHSTPSPRGSRVDGERLTTE